MKIKILSILIISILISCRTKPIIETKPEIIVKLEVDSEISNSDLISGKSIFESHCSSCHQLYDPKEFDKNEWKSITKRMQKKAHLDNDEILKVYNYLVVDMK